MKGWKFLDPTGATYPHRRDGTKEMVYLLPRPGQKWGDWMRHPNPAEPDGRTCGPGRFHIMRRLDALYAPPQWYPWFAEIRGVLGADEVKASGTEIRLRRVPPRVFWRIIRLGWCAGNDLREAPLGGADLHGANLSGTDLSDADLRYADLTHANLAGANMQFARLDEACLRGADLHRADLRGAILRHADLRYASLRYANLRGADLRGAVLDSTDLSGAKLDGALLDDDIDID